MDPMAEKYYGVSPYAYCAGNPVNRVDPSGKTIRIYYHTSDGKINHYDYNGGDCSIDNSYVNAVQHTNTIRKIGTKQVMEANLKLKFL